MTGLPDDQITMGGAHASVTGKKSTKGKPDRPGWVLWFLAGVVDLRDVARHDRTRPQSYSFSTVQIEAIQRSKPRQILEYAGIRRAATVSAVAIERCLSAHSGSGLFEESTLEPRGGNTCDQRDRSFRPKINTYFIRSTDQISRQRRSRPKHLKQWAVAIATRVQSRHSRTPMRPHRRCLCNRLGRLGRLGQPAHHARRSDNRVICVRAFSKAGLVEIDGIGFVATASFSDNRLRTCFWEHHKRLCGLVIQRDTFVADRSNSTNGASGFLPSRAGIWNFRTTAVIVSLREERNGFSSPQRAGRSAVSARRGPPIPRRSVRRQRLMNSAPR